MAANFDGTEHPHAYARLGALMNWLQGRGFTTELGRDSLTVSMLGTGRFIDTITCRPRPTDAGRLWFFSSSGEPIEQADHVTDAAVIIAGGLSELPSVSLGKMDALYIAVRRRAPQIAVRYECTPHTPDLRELSESGNHLLVSHNQQRGRISWDEVAQTYVWSSGPDKDALLPPEAEKTADRIAQVLGASDHDDPPMGD